MTPAVNAPQELEIHRSDFVQALKTAARLIGKYPGDACLRFGDGCLCIEADGTVTEAPARGSWPLPVFVRAACIRLLAKNTPPGDPIHLRTTEDKVHVNRYSESFAWTERPRDPTAGQVSEKQVIAEAAKILKPLRINRSDLQELISATRAKGAESWSPDEKKMIAIVAKAWTLLAPLGIETADLRQLVKKSVRNAWK